MGDFYTIRSRRPADGNSLHSADSTYGSGSSDTNVPTATHDISRTSYHVKHLESFAQTLQESASRAFPNTGYSSARYKKVQVLLLHWQCDDLFVLPELEDLEKCLRDEYKFETDIYAIPSENSHLKLMLKVGDLIEKHESTDTLFVIYYGGHARIDESRQSTWCATRHPASPWLQWNATQTLLERSKSDVLILLDCCAGAASATFPNGKSITETISASSWDAIAPDPGAHSFTNALIEVLNEWSRRPFSAAMLHAEVLARLKHPRPILINGKHFEARSTPVHFMMTSNHKAPSIELSRIVPEAQRLPSPPPELALPAPEMALGEDGLPVAGGQPTGELDTPVSDPDEDTPHVMISLALEDDQRLDLNAWQQWLAAFPALAKHVKIQGVFKSHSTLLLLSLPVMVWDLLPENPAYSFIAFIRSNNMIATPAAEPAPVSLLVPQQNTEEAELRDADEELDPARPDDETAWTGPTLLVGDDVSIREQPRTLRPQLNRSHTGEGFTNPWGQQRPGTSRSYQPGPSSAASARIPVGGIGPRSIPSNVSLNTMPLAPVRSMTSLASLHRQQTAPPNLTQAVDFGDLSDDKNPISRTPIMNQARNSRKTGFAPGHELPDRPLLAPHVEKRLENYFLQEPNPNVAVTEFFASNLGVETSDIKLWFHHRHQRQLMENNLQNLSMDDHMPDVGGGARMILPGHLNALLEIFPSQRVMIVDLRRVSEFERSHIHGAINLRTPLSFVEATTLDMIEGTFTDDQSRRSFGKWSQSRCVIFYDRSVEFSWECPIADALYNKFQGRGWQGQCFILKGPYREFSMSFTKYIGGQTMSQDAKDYLDDLRKQAAPTADEYSQRNTRYDEWLRKLETEDRVINISEITPTERNERVQQMQERQQELESEFKARFPALYRKAMALRPPPSAGSPTMGPPGSYQKAPMRLAKVDDFDAKVPFVEPLSRGLEKMQEAGFHAASTAAGSRPYGQTKGFAESSHADKYEDQRASEDYDEIDPKDEQLRNDPAFQKAGASRLYEAPSPVGSGDGGDDLQKKGRSPGFWKRIRSRP